jgi:hypothetical protein
LIVALPLFEWGSAIPKGIYAKIIFIENITQNNVAAGRSWFTNLALKF